MTTHPSPRLMNLPNHTPVGEPAKPHPSPRLVGCCLLILSALISSCNDEEANNKFCNLPARLTVENVQQAPVLFTACESMGEYCTVTSNGRQFLFTNAAGKTDPVNIVALSDYNGYILGLDGFIVGRLTIPEIGEDATKVVCYDRACSNCYHNYNITKPLQLQSGGYVRCHNCQRTYNLNDIGNISDGPSGRPLYRYRVSYVSNALIIANG